MKFEVQIVNDFYIEDFRYHELVVERRDVVAGDHFPGESNVGRCEGCAVVPGLAGSELDFCDDSVFGLFHFCDALRIHDHLTITTLFANVLWVASMLVAFGTIFETLTSIPMQTGVIVGAVVIFT